MILISDNQNGLLCCVGYKILGINNVKVQNASEFGAQFSRIRPGVSCNLEVLSFPFFFLCVASSQV